MYVYIISVNKKENRHLGWGGESTKKQRACSYMSITGIQGQPLEVTVVACSKLRDTEWISRQDPYVCLEYGSTKFRTRTCTDGGKNPVFQEKFVFPLIEGLRELNVVVWNSNTITLDDLIGSGKIQLHKVLSQGFDDSAWPLQTKTGRYAGEVKLILHYAIANHKKSDSSYAPSAPPYVPPATPQVPLYSAPSSGPATSYPPPPSVAPYLPTGSAPAYPPVASTVSYPPPSTAYPAPSPYPSHSSAYPPSSYPASSPYPPSSYPASSPYPPSSYPASSPYPSFAYPPSSYPPPPSYPPTSAYPPPPYPPPAGYPPGIYRPPPY